MCVCVCAWVCVGILVQSSHSALTGLFIFFFTVAPHHATLILYERCVCRSDLCQCRQTRRDVLHTVLHVTAMEAPRCYVRVLKCYLEVFMLKICFGMLMELFEFKPFFLILETSHAHWKWSLLKKVLTSLPGMFWPRPHLYIQGCRGWDQ